VTARICHDHFERVVIVEPEAWLATAEGWDPNIRSQKNTRSRVVQYHSIQGWLIWHTSIRSQIDYWGITRFSTVWILGTKETLP
jgi:hypothetical protein